MLPALIASASLVSASFNNAPEPDKRLCCSFSAAVISPSSLVNLSVSCLCISFFLFSSLFFYSSASNCCSCISLSLFPSSFFFLFLLLQKFFVSAICRPCTAKQCWSNCHIDCLTVCLSSHIVFHQSHSINSLFS